MSKKSKKILYSLILIIVFSTLSVATVLYFNIGVINVTVNSSDIKIMVSGETYPIDLNHEVSVDVGGWTCVNETFNNTGNSTYFISFNIMNASDYYDALPDDESVIIRIEPNSFTLLPNESKNVSFCYTASTMGTFHSEIKINADLSDVDGGNVFDYFEIECTNGTAINTEMTVEVAEDGKSCTFVIDANPGGNIKANYSALNFSISPIPPDGSTADSLATIYFTTDYDMKFGGEHVLQETGGVYFANWTYRAGDNSQKTVDYASSMTMLMTETGWAEIDYKIDADQSDAFGEELDTVGEGGSWHITFHNSDWSWKETFTVNWIYIG